MRRTNALRIAGGVFLCSLFAACSDADRPVDVTGADSEGAIVTAINGLRDKMPEGRIAADLDVLLDNDRANRIANEVGFTRAARHDVIQCNGDPSTCYLNQAEGVIVLVEASFDASMGSVTVGIHQPGLSKRQALEFSNYDVDLALVDGSWEITEITEVGGS